MTAGGEFERGGITIDYDDVRPDEGSGAPIVLVHGFASNRTNNWADTGWYETLLDRGRRVIALDNRGHGESDAPADPTVYDLPTMAADVIGLLDHLEVAAADLFGYSMGGRIGLHLVQHHADRFNAAVLGGIGANAITDDGRRVEGIARALEAEDGTAIEHDVARDFRLFAESTGGDLEALAAVVRAHGEATTEYDLGGVALPVLIAAGEADDIVADPVGLATEFPNGEAALIPDEDHLSTVPNAEFVCAVTDFLDREGL